MKRWLLIAVLVGCGGGSSGGGELPDAVRNVGWHGVVQSVRAGPTDAGLYLRLAVDSSLFGSYVARVQGLTGEVTGVVVDGGYSFHIRPTACDGGFDGAGRIDGGVLEFSYSGFSCVGQDTGSGTLLQEYDLPAH